MVSVVRRMNEVAARRVRLIPGWVTVCRARIVCSYLPVGANVYFYLILGFTRVCRPNRFSIGSSVFAELTGASGPTHIQTSAQTTQCQTCVAIGRVDGTHAVRTDNMRRAVMFFAVSTERDVLRDGRLYS